MTCPRFASFTLGSWKIQILLSEPTGYLEEVRVTELFPLASSNLLETSNELSENVKGEEKKKAHVGFLL